MPRFITSAFFPLDTASHRSPGCTVGLDGEHVLIPPLPRERSEATLRSPGSRYHRAPAVFRSRGELLTGATDALRIGPDAAHARGGMTGLRALEGSAPSAWRSSLLRRLRQFVNRDMSSCSSGAVRT